MDKLRRALSGDERQPDEESGIMPQVKLRFVIAEIPSLLHSVVQNQCCNFVIYSLSFQLLDSTSLSWETRIKGFIICFVIGVLCSFLGTLFLFLHKGMALFAVFYTLGNVVSILRWAFICKMCPFVYTVSKSFATLFILPLFNIQG